MKTRFERGWDLADLPWFDRVDGLLTVIDDDVGPIIDMHTHLAMAPAAARKAARLGCCDGASHYLPMDDPLDLELYANKNISEAGLKRMKLDLGFGALRKDSPALTHSPDNLLKEMSALGIVQSVLLPIDAPWPNKRPDAFLDVAAERSGLLSFGSVHPYAGDASRRLDRQLDQGALGVKLHPSVQLIRPDHPRTMAAYALCAERDLPVLIHCGPVGIEPRLVRDLSQLKHYWRAITDNPQVTFLLGHSGALQFELALELAQRYENVWLELSCQSLANVRRMVDDGPADRIVLGSDWPWYHQGMPISKVLMATEHLGAADRRSHRRRIFHDNAARLLGAAVPS